MKIVGQYKIIQNYNDRQNFQEIFQSKNCVFARVCYEEYFRDLKGWDKFIYIPNDTQNYFFSFDTQLTELTIIIMQ